MNVNGLKISDIIDMSWDDIGKLSTQDLKQLTSRLVSASNKRIRRLEKTRLGTSSYAYQTVEERGRKFSVRGMNRNQTLMEFGKARHFLQSKTSTVKGWKDVLESTEERITKTLDTKDLKWSDKTWSKFWKVYRRFEENHSGTFKKGDSTRFQQFITEIMQDSDKRRSADHFTQKIEEEYAKYYESAQSMFDVEDEEDSEETDID